MAKELTLSKLKNTDFINIYSKFLKNDQLTRSDYELVLSLAVCFINSQNADINRLGYRIIVQYANRTQDYAPLYEIAINYGLYPISKMIDAKFIDEERKNIFTEFNNAITEYFKDIISYKNPEEEDSKKTTIYRTREQKKLKEFFSDKTAETVAVIAPTSYGKSELFSQLIRDFRGKKIGIIVPTKALLAQTQRRIKDDAKGAGFSKIIVTPEMYNNELSFLAVLTQERLLRLFKCHPYLAFDCLVIDEAHELLEEGERSKLLAHAIILAQKRYQGTVFKFMTPFVADANKLSVRYTIYTITQFRTFEYIKSEKFFFYDLLSNDLSPQLMLYDQFMDRMIDMPTPTGLNSEEDIILKYKAGKNIIYLNKPQDIENFALKLAQKLPPVHSDVITTICNQLSEHIDGRYNLVQCLQKGIIYHHSSVPDIIKIYIENIYKNYSDIQYIISTSTLLSGVNIPAEKIFLLDCKKGGGKLTRSQFKNLTGRVCRFKEIFAADADSLQLLEPEIYIIRGNYSQTNINYQNFIIDVARIDKKQNDTVKNILLNGASLSEKEAKELAESTALIENYEPGTIKDYSGRHLTTAIGKACIRNAITSFPVFEYEQRMQQKADAIKAQDGMADSPPKLIAAISAIFFADMGTIDKKLPQLQKQEVCRFYTMLLDWRINNKSYREMIAAFVGYWKKIAKTSPYVYVGKWGDIALYNQKFKYYINFPSKSPSEIVNLAIVKIKEEQDVIDNILIRYIEALYDIQMVNDSLYKKIKYGTDDPDVICMVKNGLPPYIAMILAKKYSDYTTIDSESSTLSIDGDIEDAMRRQQENVIVQYAISTFID